MKKTEKLPNKICGLRIRKKKVARKLQYEKWYAYKRIRNKLHWIYLGRTSEGAQPKIEAYLERLAIKNTSLPLFDSVDKEQPNQTNLEKKREQLIKSIAKTIKTAKEIHALLDAFVPGIENPGGYLETRFIEIEKATLQIEALAKGSFDR